MNFLRGFSFKPEEFVVEEITAYGKVLGINQEFNLGNAAEQSLEKDYFSRFVLQKNAWNTEQAL